MANLHFPIGGMVRRLAFQHGSPYTCDDALNVWPDDPIAERERGGSRWGLEKYYATDLGAAVRGGGVVRFNNETRALATSAGKLFRENSGDWQEVTGGSGTIISTRFVPIVEHLGDAYIFGDNSANEAIIVYDSSANSRAVITASAGTAPTKCTTATVVFDRLVAAGDADNPNLWYMSKRGDPTDWDDAPATVTVDTAVTASTQDFGGRLGDRIVSLIRHTNDCMIIACQSSVHVIRDDPRVGGTNAPLNTTLGIVDVNAWCHTPEGWLFMLTQDGVYAMRPGCGSPLIDVSRKKLPKELVGIDSGTYTVHMEYCYKSRMILLHVTKLSGSDGTGHYAIDVKATVSSDNVIPETCSFFPMEYSTSHEAYSMWAYNDDFTPDSNTSVVMIGCQDGTVRRHANDVFDDDGTDFNSNVLYGPIPLGGMEGEYTGQITKIRGAPGSNSKDIDYEIYVGLTPEEAYDNYTNKLLAWQGTWNEPGFNGWDYPRCRGAWAYINVLNGENNDRWAIEQLIVDINAKIGMLR